MKEAQFYLVGTPIGNLGDISLRAIETLKAVDLIYCEDTRRSQKLLNHFEIKKKLISAPYFRERKSVGLVEEVLRSGQRVAYITDAGMPGVSDPGSILLGEIRKLGYRVEVIGGPSALTNFIGLLGVELEKFEFVGFLPAKRAQRERFFSESLSIPKIFFESPHRLESSLLIIQEKKPLAELCLAKELTKISERFYEGRATSLLKSIESWKGEWVGLIWPDEDKDNAAS
ncbi:MAG: 16S rRNA (cytidine(1402)-2'-O)-methyltransferase [Deltaproteobacteria bacterium CG11_big_fil_rev_8_21_14_0_20_45_16]|nr:MAG: 16S rRNA (cytidine(1402)-2'-O)-methyltransferase [Deltaproteobacteria bacterium CG11_big_fil_rev_8_21_14_0_20_45_16]